MRKIAFIILINFVMILSTSYCYSQDQKKLKIYIEGGYQLWNNKTYFLGAGAKMRKPLKSKMIDYYEIHTSLFYEKFVQPDYIKTNYGLTSRVAYDFKYFSVGLFVRHFNLMTNNEYRLDMAPEIGIGYKYLWLNYSRNLLLYQEKTIPVSKNNFRIMINIPLFDIKL